MGQKGHIMVQKGLKMHKKRQKIEFLDLKRRFRKNVNESVPYLNLIFICIMRAIETVSPADIPSNEPHLASWNQNCKWFCDVCHLIWNVHFMNSMVSIVMIIYPLQSTWILSICARAPDITRSRTTSVSLYSCSSWLPYSTYLYLE